MTSRSTPVSSRPASSKAAKEAAAVKEKEDKEKAAAEAAAEKAAAEELLLADDSPPVNYVDVKIHCVNNIPAAWINDSGPPPLFSDHAFRYEVDVNVGGKKHTFSSGRVLQSLPGYEEFIERAQLPPPVPQIDPDDQPEYNDPRRRAKETFKDVPSNVAGDLPPPPLASVIVTQQGSSASVLSNNNNNANNESSNKTGNTPITSNISSARAAVAMPHLSVQPPPGAAAASVRGGPAGGAASSATAAAAAASMKPGGDPKKKNSDPDPDAPPPTPVGIYWLLGPENDTDLKEDLAARAKEAKQSNAAKKKGEVVQVVEVKPPQPTQPLFCVTRLALSPKQLAHFETQVEQSVPLTLTFRRVLRTTCPSEWGEDSNEAKFQAKVRIPLRDLQRPGALKMSRIEVLLDPIPPEVPVDDKTHGKQRKAGAAASSTAKRQKGNAPLLLNEDPFADHDGMHPYTSNRTVAIVSVETFTPITRLPSTRLKPAIDPCDLIPRRIRPPARQADATKIFADNVEQLMLRIVRDHREHKTAVAQQVLATTNGGGGGNNNSNDSPGNNLSAMSNISQEELRSTFLSMLQTTGKIHTYKELLVPAVEAVVRETFLRQPKPSNADLERSASELYTYLMDHVHLKLNELFTSSGAKRIVSASEQQQLQQLASATAVVPGSNNGGNSGSGESAAARWARLAKEAEVMGDTEKATRYWQQRLVCGWSGVADPSTGRVADESGETQAATVAAWNDFAEFCLRCRDVIKAEQGYKEAVSLDPTFVPALVGYGVLLTTRSRFAEAEVFLQSAVDLSPSVLTWGVLAMFFDALLLSLPNSPEEQVRLASCKREARYALSQAMKLAEETGLAAREAAAVAAAQALVEQQHSSSASGSGASAEKEEKHGAATTTATSKAEREKSVGSSKEPNTGRGGETTSAVSSSETGSNGNNNSDNAVQPTTSESVATKPAQIAVYMALAKYLLDLHHEDLVNVCLSRVPNTANVDLLFARLFSQTKQCDEAHAIAGRIRAVAQNTADSLQRELLQQQQHQQQQSAHGGASSAIGMASAAASSSFGAESSGRDAADRNDDDHHHHHLPQASMSVKEAAARHQQQLQEKLCAAHTAAARTHLLQADICVQQHMYQDAERHYELAFKADADTMTGPHFVRLGNSYIRLGKYKDALVAFSYAAKLWPCGLSWLGVGIAYYRMDDLSRAELALNESNVMNNLCTRTWAFLALVCFRQKREGDGDQAFNQAIKLGLSDAALMAEIGSEQGRLGRHGVAEACYRRSLALQDDPNVRMQLARVLMQMRRLPDARTEFVAVARTTGNDAQRQKAEEHAANIAAVSYE